MLVRAFELWLAETQGVTGAPDWELNTLQRTWLRAPLRLLRWWQQRKFAKPKEWPRAQPGLAATLLGAPP